MLRTALGHRTKRIFKLQSMLAISKEGARGKKRYAHIEKSKLI